MNRAAAAGRDMSRPGKGLTILRVWPKSTCGIPSLSSNVVCDTGPLLAAANRSDEYHALAAAIVSMLGRNLIVPTPAIVEADYLLRTRVSSESARLLLSSLSDGEHQVGYVTTTLFERAVEIDNKYADLDLGITDSVVMAYAEKHDLPVFTFDFRAFRATRPRSGHWNLIVDESRLAAARGG